MSVADRLEAELEEEVAEELDQDPKEIWEVIKERYGIVIAYDPKTKKATLIPQGEDQ